MPEPTRILFTIPNFITAGSGQAMLNIVEHLDPEKYAPAVCVTRKGGDLSRVVEKLGIPFFEAPFTVPAQPYLTLPARAWRAAQVFRPYHFNLWHSFHYLDDYTEPIIAHLSGARRWIYTKKNMNWGRRAWYLRSLFASRIAAQNTDMMRSFFGNVWFRNRARLIPCGVDVDRFYPGGSASLGIRTQEGIPENAIVCACVAHLVPVKGHPTLIEAVAKIPGMHVLIAGSPLDANYFDKLQEMTSKLGLEDRVHFIGSISNVPALLAEVDIFVLPTERRGEGSPVALLEAMACGCACVGTDVPGSRDLIEHGKSGWIVSPEESAALAEALRGLAASSELRRSLGEAARARILSRYTIAREAADHAAMYADLHV
ncbi:MAG TPA: glycosyltransferase [Armatimonadota bacterium]|nr:glycosyltransferase [Armatimonadota bacterium]